MDDGEMIMNLHLHLPRRAADPPLLETFTHSCSDGCSNLGTGRVCLLKGEERREESISGSFADSTFVRTIYTRVKLQVQRSGTWHRVNSDCLSI